MVRQFSVIELLTELVADFATIDSSAEIRLLEISDTLGDPALIRQVFQNLISNSLNYQPEGQQAVIEISGVVEADRVVYSIQDNGIGIAAKFSDRIYQPLIRLHRSDSTYPGHRIGLAFVRNAIQAHGGSAWLDSRETESSNGSRFLFLLPVR